jgi:hypothetical protein
VSESMNMEISVIGSCACQVIGLLVVQVNALRKRQKVAVLEEA